MGVPANKAQTAETISKEDPRLTPSDSQVVFRQVNEETRRLADNCELDELQVVCECEHGNCLAQLSVAIDDYEAVRRFPTRFLVRASHVGSDERVVEETPDYCVVEKVGPGAAAAIRHDPRKRTARERVV